MAVLASLLYFGFAVLCSHDYLTDCYLVSDDYPGCRCTIDNNPKIHDLMVAQADCDCNAILPK